MLDQYAVIGNPIAQSKSPFIHSAFAAANGQTMRYDALQAPDDGFVAAVTAFRAAGGRGLNVTSPFKLDAFGYATVRHPRAEEAGAANCLRFDGDAVEAENFDGIGLFRDITVNLATPVHGHRVLLLGAGGAARGALTPLLDSGPAHLVIANRTRDKAATLAAGRTGLQASSLDDAGRHGPFDIVINATSASLHGSPLTLPDRVFAEGCLAYDMTYGKGLTAFLLHAGEAGAARLHDGVGMLVEQAAEAFAWWRGVRPDTRRVIEQLTVPLA